MPEDKQFDNSVPDADKKVKATDAAAKLKELQEKMKQLESEFQELAESTDNSDGAEGQEKDADRQQSEQQESEEPETSESEESAAQEPDEAQGAAAKRYETLFGDRRRQISIKPKRGVIRILAGTAVIILLIIVALRIPTFFNAGTPSSVDSVKTFGSTYGYEEWEDKPAFYFTLDETNAKKAAQGNIIVNAELNLFANIVYYEFDTTEAAKEYLQSVADKNGVTAEFKTFVFSMGACSYGAENDGYYYESWFSGKMLVEVYATYQLPADENDTTQPYETAKMLRGLINRLA